MDHVTLACLAWTYFAYFMARKIYRKKPLMIFSLIVTTSVSIIILMLPLGISYGTCHKYVQSIVLLLAPATITLTIPIYENHEVIRRQLPILLVAIMVGMSVGIVSAFPMGNMFHFDSEVTNSLMARLVSTPFAAVLAGEICGSAALVSLFIIVTGPVGMIFGDLLLTSIRIHFHTVNGITSRNAAHGFDTSRIGQRRETEGAVAGLTMALTGLFMVLFGSSMVHLVV